MKVWITTKLVDDTRLQEAVTCIGLNRGLAVTRCVCEDDNGDLCAGFVVTHILSGRAITRHMSKTRSLRQLEILAALTDWRSYESTILPGTELNAIWEYIKAHRMHPQVPPKRFGGKRHRKPEV